MRLAARMSGLEDEIVVSYGGEYDASRRSYEWARG